MRKSFVWEGCRSRRKVLWSLAGFVGVIMSDTGIEDCPGTAKLAPKPDDRRPSFT